MLSSSNDAPAQSQSVAIIQSPLFGGNCGTQFNDIERVVGFPASLTINVDRPLKYITIMYGGVIDGIELEYAKNDAETTKFSHGTSSRTNLLNRGIVTLGDKEVIVAVSGLHGSSIWGVRVLQLSFAICDTRTGKMRVAGPFGGGLSDSTPQPFHLTANGSFVALGGFAINTDLSLGELKAAGKNGGLYGLTFIDVAYRSV
ncbi:hypothetical protein EST38_g11046 [Candolleomyces aberdarensis]|uniref:Jacalin-type lectin domain-containing protein n=1 Tax=Candolleomyces aberdarensis TaxID=2316362 RepID=A0A4Q2D860_9AGAR|nr:hypothetical protein EST38_g11046 [Candolleomyces aberdarensis]